jgi:hypothetical protein
MLREFKDPWKALVSYNCGPEILRQGLPIPGESRRYASKVLRVFARRRLANDRSMSFVEPYLTLSTEQRLGAKEILKVSKPLFCSDS